MKNSSQNLKENHEKAQLKPAQNTLYKKTYDKK